MIMFSGQPIFWKCLARPLDLGWHDAQVIVMYNSNFWKSCAESNKHDRYTKEIRRLDSNFAFSWAIVFKRFARRRSLGNKYCKHQPKSSQVASFSDLCYMASMNYLLMPCIHKQIQHWVVPQFIGPLEQFLGLMSTAFAQNMCSDMTTLVPEASISDRESNCISQYMYYVSCNFLSLSEINIIGLKFIQITYELSVIVKRNVSYQSSSWIVKTMP